MKISNFRDLQKLPSNKRTAKVDVETGWWIFKKVKTEIIFQETFSLYWRWLYNGETTPSAVDDLEKAYFIQKEMEENATT